jgi:hypothetical protein
MITAEELRRVVLSLPEAEERETWGHPTFRVRDRMFAALSDDGREPASRRPGRSRRPWSPPPRRPSASPPTWAATAG